MRQSITTKYCGPTNTRGSRIQATARKASSLGKAMAASLPYGYGPTDEEHCAAAQYLAAKLAWSGLWYGGGSVDETGFVYVNLGNDSLKGHCDIIEGREGADWFFIPRKDFE